MNHDDADSDRVTDFAAHVVALASPDHPRRSWTQRLGAILWPSFFSAGVATMVFFAHVDPLALAEISFPGWPVSRELGYTIAFFMFWLCTASSSVFTWLLLRPASRFNQPIERD